MVAYAIFIRDRLRDPETITQYYEKLPLSFEGRDFVRRVSDREPQVLEGAPMDSVVVLEFATAASARAWYDSEAYREARAFRHLAADYRVVIVEGLPAEMTPPLAPGRDRLFGSR
jgi:uncharacterized protein (DUF1330 family)